MGEACKWTRFCRAKILHRLCDRAHVERCENKRLLETHDTGFGGKRKLEDLKESARIRSNANKGP
jgi:hypothetical protein